MDYYTLLVLLQLLIIKIIATFTDTAMILVFLNIFIAIIISIYDS